MSHCDRSWHTGQTGSAGSCFFFLNAGDSYECSGSGVINIIGAHGLSLGDDVSFFGQTVQWTQGLPGCEAGTHASSCTYSNLVVHDQWIALTFVSHSKASKHHKLTDDGSSVSCQYTEKADETRASTEVLVSILKSWYPVKRETYTNWIDTIMSVISVRQSTN